MTNKTTLSFLGFHLYFISFVKHHHQSIHQMKQSYIKKQLEGEKVISRLNSSLKIPCYILLMISKVN